MEEAQLRRSKSTFSKNKNPDHDTDRDIQIKTALKKLISTLFVTKNIYLFSYFQGNRNCYKNTHWFQGFATCSRIFGVATIYFDDHITSSGLKLGQWSFLISDVSHVFT